MPKHSNGSKTSLNTTEIQLPYTYSASCTQPASVMPSKQIKALYLSPPMKRILIQALLYHTFAALAGNTRSEMTVAYRHLMGIGTPRSCEDSVHYYKSVADKCNLPSLPLSRADHSNNLLPLRPPRWPPPPPQHNPPRRRPRRPLRPGSLLLLLGHQRLQTQQRKLRLCAEHRRCPRVPAVHGREGRCWRAVFAREGVL
jgi:hypothetical protein